MQANLCNSCMHQKVCHDVFKKNTFLKEEMRLSPSICGDYKAKITIETVKEILDDYFDIATDTYAYNLTRVKSAFNVGTVTLDDFEEFTEETTRDLAEYILKKLSN